MANNEAATHTAKVTTMESFLEFVKELNSRIGVKLPPAWASLGEVVIAQRFLSKLNEYLYQTYQGIGTTTFDEEELRYFSEFHKFWEQHHAEILNARVNRSKATLAAELLHLAVEKHGCSILDVTVETHGLSKEAIAQVRFFTANQDFRRPPENQYLKYQEDPGQFHPHAVADDPAGFLSFLGMTSLSQSDKRLDFANNAARFLLDNGITAYQIAEHFANDAVKIRSALTSQPNMGYGNKKANMFLRDMFVFGVWPDLKNVSKVDVATDINTMKIALRTGVLTTEIPLLSSFLDIFCHQYSHIYDMAAQAWRAVWEEWQRTRPSSAPASPCLIDFMLYRMGREYCKNDLVRYQCEKGHHFYHFGARLKKCKVCTEQRMRSPAMPQVRLLPCQIPSAQLPRDNGEILISDTNLLRTFAGVCIFEEVCMPKVPGFRPLDPPKSISIKGETGWTSAYADRDRAGGGLMA